MATHAEKGAAAISLRLLARRSRLSHPKTSGRKYKGRLYTNMEAKRSLCLRPALGFGARNVVKIYLTQVRKKTHGVHSGQPYVKYNNMTFARHSGTGKTVLPRLGRSPVPKDRTRSNKNNGVTVEPSESIIASKPCVIEYVILRTWSMSPFPPMILVQRRNEKRSLSFSNRLRHTF